MQAVAARLGVLGELVGFGLGGVLWALLPAASRAAAPDPSGGESGYVARAAGPARFALQAGATGNVLVRSGGLVVGFGEIVPLADAAAGALHEFRGYVPRGRFTLGAPGPAQAARAPRVQPERRLPAIRLGESTHQFERCEGSLCPRWRLQSRVEDLRVRADAYFWPSGERELRLELEFVTGGEELPERLELRWGEERLHLAEGDELGPPIAAIEVAPLALRPGDRHYVTLFTHAGDPSLRVWCPDELRAAFGYGLPERDARPARLPKEVAIALRDAVLALPVAPGPVDRGDHRRPTGDEEIWTHGEFDLALGLELFAQEARDDALRARARDAVLHLLGRDFAPARHGEGGRLRLPAVHGTEHGRGRVAAGHVFLEGALLHALAGAERLLLERLLVAFDDLAEFAGARAGSAWHVRDVAWPLLQLTVALRFARRVPWRDAAEQLVRRLAESWDPALRVFDFASVQRQEEVVLELWIVAGLVLPALDRAAELGLGGAAELRGRLVEGLTALPANGGALATHYASALRGGMRPAAASRRNAACAAWVVEGLLGRGAPWNGRVRRLEREVLRELPGEGWDAATRAALLLRLRWLRPGLRALRRGP